MLEPGKPALPRNRKPETRVVRLIAGFYFLMGAVGLGVAWARRGAFERDPFLLSFDGWPVYLGVTAGLVVAIHLATRWAMARIPSLRSSGRDIRTFLGDLRPNQVAVVALASGLGEELLFRGWLLNEIGLVWSSLIFGLIHIPPSRQWLYWPAFAMAMGFILGWLFLWTGSIVYPVILHAGVNYLNILLALSSSAGGETDR